MKKRTVLIVENRPGLRAALYHGLTLYGLDAVAAESAEAAWEAAQQAGDIDVALLDVQLGPSENGLQFGLRLKNARKDWPPEFLVYSAYDKPEYYQMALALGAAAYLQKGKYGGDFDQPPHVEVLVQHIRALALRRSLHSERPEFAERLRTVAETSSSREEAIARFCSDILVPELKNTFGDRFALLLSNGRRTTAFSGPALGSPSDDVLERIQAAVYARVGDADPLIVKSAEFLGDLPPAEQDAARALDNAAFIILAPPASFRLSLGLLATNGDATPTRHQAKILDSYFNREIVGHLLHLTQLWSELELKRRLEAQKREVLLTATSKFCLYQGQEILSVLFDAQQDNEDMDGLVPVGKLQTIGKEMLNAGQILSHFAHSDEPLMASDQRGLPMAQLIAKVWSTEVSPRLGYSSAADMLRVIGECSAYDHEERAGRAVSQILGWMGRRVVRFGERDDDLALFVMCNPPRDRNRVQVVFEERTSNRLSRGLRRSFFEPFYVQSANEPIGEKPDGGRRLGLYLAQTLAQLAGGALSDDSDRLEGPRGHRFVLELPAALDA